MISFLKSKIRFIPIFFAGFFVVIHYASITYINSSLLTDALGSKWINIPYIIGSLLSIVFLVISPKLVKKYGSVKTFAFFVLIQIFSVFGMGFTPFSILVILFFVVHHAGESMLNFFIDLNMEKEIKKENTTGMTRGALLTFQNIAWVVSPLLLSILASGNNLKNVYLLSSLILTPLIFLIFVFFKDTREADTKESNTFKIIKELFRGGDTARIIFIQFILNLFYSWMVIYLPLLLHKEMNIGWDKIGIIFTIMLLPFLLFQLPAGIIGDKKTGEKELLIIGFIIIGLSTLIIPRLDTQNFIIWGLVLFLTRIGASIVEISSESYFFKHTKEKDTAMISIFRMMRPLSFLFVPLITIPIINYYSYSFSFYFLATITALGLFFIPKTDTR